MTFGGRAAEEIVFGKISTGALSDLERITKMAYSMVTIYGMNAAIGNISFYDSKQSEYNFNKPYSEATAERIDVEVKKIIDSASIARKIFCATTANISRSSRKSFSKKRSSSVGPRAFDRQASFRSPDHVPEVYQWRVEGAERER